MSRWPEYRRALNITHAEHAAYAMLMQLPFVAFGLEWVGALFSTAFFIGREHAQAQHSYDLGDLRAFDVRLWSRDGQLDLVCPVLAVCLLGSVVSAIKGFSS